MISIDKTCTSVIKGHKRKIVCLALNYNGTIVATASGSGSKIKVFYTGTGQQLQELRRGAKRAEILQITFHQSSQFLACTSNKESVHIFELFDSLEMLQKLGAKGNFKDISEDEIGYKNNKIELNPNTKNEVTKFASVSWISSYFKSHWSLAKLKLTDINKYCSFADGNNFIIVTMTGKLYIFEIPKTGGYCVFKSIENIDYID